MHQLMQHNGHSTEPARADSAWHDCCSEKFVFSPGKFMTRLLNVAILVISTMPLYAQGQQPNAERLKADARNLVGVIGGDKAKTRAYCQILDLVAQLDREKNRKKTTALSQKIDQLQKQLGPEFLAVTNGLQKIDLNSPDGQEIVSMISKLDQSCD